MRGVAGHHHHHIDWAQRLTQLRMADALDAEALRPVAQGLVGGLTADEPVVVDVGCGAGGMSVLLARALAERGGGTVVLVDSTLELLAEAERAVAAESGVKVEAIHADFGDAPLPAADLVWASGVVHHVADQQAALNTLAATLNSDGTLAIVEGGLRISCLPWDLGVGRPGLEDRLHTVRAEWYAAMRASIPGAVDMPYGWPVALRRAGLGDVTSAGVLIDHPMPGSDLLRDYVVHRIGSLAESGADWLADEDRAAVAALLDPDGPDFLGARDDLYLLGVKTVHSGRKS